MSPCVEATPMACPGVHTGLASCHPYTAALDPRAAEMVLTTASLSAKYWSPHSDDRPRPTRSLCRRCCHQRVRCCPCRCDLGGSAQAVIDLFSGCGGPPYGVKASPQMRRVPPRVVMLKFGRRRPPAQSRYPRLFLEYCPKIRCGLV
jgi:hypothetical protein